MSISGALANAVSGLTANGRQLAVASDNLANALTPGYGAREVTLTGRSGGSGGVRVVSVDRQLDPALTALRRDADAAAAEAGILAEGLGRLAGAVGELGEEGGLFEANRRFDASLRALADTPESGPKQSAAVSAAKDLAASFNTAYADATALRAEADSEIGRVVDRVNTNLAEIATLNRDIVRAEALDRPTGDLIDRFGIGRP